MVPPALIDQVAADLRAFPEASIATLAEPLDDVQTLFNPNAVKVVTDHQGFAVSLSRAPMPWNRDAFADGRPEKLPGGALFRRRTGLFASKVGVLHGYVRWP